MTSSAEAIVAAVLARHAHRAATYPCSQDHPDPERLARFGRHRRVTVDVDAVLRSRRDRYWQDYINQHRKGKP